MFCYQCEQTVKGRGCTSRGNCGKEPLVAGLQDVLTHNLIGLAFYAQRLNHWEMATPRADVAIVDGLYATGTNVNFDPERLHALILDSQAVKEETRRAFVQAHVQKTGAPFSEDEPEAARFVPADTIEAMTQQAGQLEMRIQLDDDIQSLRTLLLLGLRGMAAYTHHLRVLGARDEPVVRFITRGLAALSSDSSNLEEWIAWIMEAGQVNLQGMEILDQAHTERWGHPTPTAVPTGVRQGPAILVSGHDLFDLEALLKQSEGRGITIYTHGEMLPAHAYPRLKQYSHLYANYGGAWQDQQKEFARFPGAILMTTNCLQRPTDAYRDRLFTTGPVGWPGVRHLSDRDDLSPVIDAALELGGFAEDRDEQTITVGFGHQAVLGVADQVVQAVKAGDIRHFFLIGGCDGARPGRNYYTELAEQVPQDSIILTLACGKYRFNKLELGTVAGLPRLLDVGQCNDAYSAIRIAQALAEAFETTVNELPLSLILSWYEQKAVCILLTLLSLGIKNIRLGPSLPTFVSPGVLDLLVKQFNLQPTTTVEADLAQSLAR